MADITPAVSDPRGFAEFGGAFVLPRVAVSHSAGRGAQFMTSMTP